MEFAFNVDRMKREGKILEIIRRLDFLHEFTNSVVYQLSEIVRELRKELEDLVLGKEVEMKKEIKYEDELADIEDSLKKVLFKVKMLRGTFRKEVKT